MKKSLSASARLATLSAHTKIKNYFSSIVVVKIECLSAVVAATSEKKSGISAANPSDGSNQ